MNTKNIKPFALEAALKGEPVMLRDGTKAFVRHHEKELNVANSVRLLGYIANGASREWGENGSYSTPSDITPLDIIGMYPKIRIINGFEVPTAETKAPALYSEYYLVKPCSPRFHEKHFWKCTDIEIEWLERGLIFLNKENAIANAKAMLGINPYEESEE